MVTVLIDNRIMEVPSGHGASGQLWMTTSEADRISGGSLHAQGLHKGDADGSISSGQTEKFLRGDEVDIAALWRDMGKPALSDEAGTVWVLGESAEARGAALRSLQAPDFTLPDLEGNPHSLSDFRGKKVFLASWASW